MEHISDENVTYACEMLLGEEYYGMSEAEHDDGWYDRVDMAWYRVGYDDSKYSSDILALRDRLLQHGGNGVVLIDPHDPDAPRLLKRGMLWDGSNYVMMRGDNNQCHSNSAHLWDKNKDKVVLCTGYALSDDGLWRQHSWCIQVDPPAIVETTQERIAYFGYFLDDNEADLFLYENY